MQQMSFVDSYARIEQMSLQSVSERVQRYVRYTQQENCSCVFHTGGHWTVKPRLPYGTNQKLSYDIAEKLRTERRHTGELLTVPLDRNGKVWLSKNTHQLRAS